MPLTPHPSTLPLVGEPTADDLAGMAWYNAQTEETLRFWHGIAGSAAPVDAWIAYRDTAGNDCLPPATQTAASLPAPAAGQRVGTHSYLWRQIFFTEPVGQWLCASGHSCRWSIKRSDQASLDRVQRRRA